MVLFHKLSRFKDSPKVKELFEVLYLQYFTTQYVFINGYISIGNATDKKAKGLMVGGARCSSVVREFAHGAMGRGIDPSWGGPIELFLVPASAPRLV